METDPTRAIEWMIGLPAVAFLGAEDGDDGEARIHVETTAAPVGCPRCGTLAQVKDRSRVVLVDLPLFGRPARLVWHKRRWRCTDPDCAMRTWTEEHEHIAARRQILTSRAARWVTVQVGRRARSVREVAHDLGCDWHTVNDAVLAYGEALVEADTDRIGEVSALGLDEVLMVRRGPYRRQEFSTQIVDVRAGKLLDVVPGRSGAGPMAWLAEQGPGFRARIELRHARPLGPLPPGVRGHDARGHARRRPLSRVPARQHQARRVPPPRPARDARAPGQASTDPLYRCRRLLTRAKERLGDQGHTRSSPASCVPVTPEATWPPCGRRRRQCESCTPTPIPSLALEWVTQLGHDLQDPDYPIEARSLGRTLIRWKHEIAAWHQAHVTNGPTEAVNNLIKRVKRAAFGFTSFRNYRIRSLLYAGKPNWALLATVSPR